MSEPAEWLQRGLERYEARVRDLERDLAAARAKRDAFQEVIEEWNRRFGGDSPNGDSPRIATALSEDMNTREAVVEVLRRADHPLTISEIAERSERMGKKMKNSSIRWDVNEGAKEGLYEKLPPREGERGKRYRYIG